MPLATFQIEDYSHRVIGETHLPSNRNEIIDEIGLLKEAGATVIQVAAPRTASVEHFLEWTEWFAREIMPPFAA